MKNELKRKPNEGKVCGGAWITIDDADVVDILKRLQFDWIVFDAEHSPMSIGGSSKPSDSRTRHG